jgi:chromosomal replication initiator protein
LLATATLTGRRADLALAQSTLREIVRQPRQALTLKSIEACVCQKLRCDSEALRSPRKDRAIAHARAVAMYLARQHTAASFAEIGAHFGGRNHATVIAACRRIERELAADRGPGRNRADVSTAGAIALVESALGV